MTVDELRRAITLLRLLSYGELTVFRNELLAQAASLDSEGIAKERLSILRLTSQSEVIFQNVSQVSAEISAHSATTAGHITGVQSAFHTIRQSYSANIASAAATLQESFDGDVFQVPKKLKAMIESYAGSDINLIALARGGSMLTEISEVIKSHVDRAQGKIDKKEPTENVGTKVRKILIASASRLAALIRLRDRLLRMALDCANAQSIVTFYGGPSSIQSVFNKTIEQIAGEMNV